MNKVRALAIYLPQFHPIPVNDSAWGDGFTEWTNVKKAKPLFEGHYQPQIPHESIGYYDLRDAEVLINQAALAKEFGIYGFAFYHYWFNGKLLLETPLNNMIRSGKPDFPFCYVWANENWTKKWDGFDEDIIIKQEYSFDDDLVHIRYLCNNVFNDKRYITVDDKPMFLVYRTNELPDIKKTVQIWRNEAKLLGFKDLYLVRIEAHGSNVEPKSIGFDSALWFSPDWQMAGSGQPQIGNNFSITKYDYFQTVISTVLKEKKYKCHRCVFPSWDNSPRRTHNALVFVNTSLIAFKYFLIRTIDLTKKSFEKSERYFFINAWNEWAEGCHVEPDTRDGFQYLKIIKDAIEGVKSWSNEESQFYELFENEVKILKERNLQIEKEFISTSQKFNNISLLSR